MQPYAPIPPPREGTSVWVWILAGCGGCGCLAVAAFAFSVYFIGKTAFDAMNQAYTEMKLAGRVLKVQDQKLASHKGRKFVVGVLKNTSPTETYNYVSISFHVYDSRGAEVETAEDSTESILKPGQTWRFRAPIEDSGASRVALEDILGSKLEPEEANMDPDERVRRDKIISQMKQKVQKVVDEAKERERSP
jgi:hypothetical protein